MPSAPLFAVWRCTWRRSTHWFRRCGRARWLSIPSGAWEAVGTPDDVKLMLMRLADYLKGSEITTLLTSLTAGGTALEASGVGLTSLVDTWLLLRDIELGGERNRGLYVLKSRGMEHSNQIREFLLTAQGIRLLPAYVGSEGALTGSARLTQEAREHAEQGTRDQQLRLLRLQLEARESLASEIAGLQARFRLEAGTAQGRYRRPDAAGGSGGRGPGYHGGPAPQRRAGAGPATEQRRISGMKSTAKTAKTRNHRGARPSWELRLYVAGATPKCGAAFANLKKICEEHLERPVSHRGDRPAGQPRSSPRAIRSWPFPRWSASCPNRSAS